MVVPVDLLRDGLLRLQNDRQEPVRDALQEWAEDADERGVELASPVDAPAAAGSCALCDAREATSICVHCGKAVCGNDHWVMFGLCRACLTPDELREARERPAPKPDLGIKWVED